MAVNDEQVAVSGDRKNYIDIARGIAIYLVVVGHILSGSKVYFRTVIYSFHVSLFLILAGLVQKWEVADLSQITRTVKRRFFQLIVPYMIWALLYSDCSFKSLLYILYASRTSLTKAQTGGSLWFLPMFFLSSIEVQILLYVYNKFKQNRILFACEMAGCFAIGYFLPKLSFGYPGSVNVSFMASAIVMASMLLRKLYDRMVSDNAWIKIAISLVLFCALYCCVGKCNSLSQIDYIRLSKAQYGNWILFIVQILAGSTAVILLAQSIDELVSNKRALLFVGMNSMPILCVHARYVNWFADFLDYTGVGHNNVFAAMAVGIVCILISVPIILFLKRYMPAVIGDRINR